MSVRTVADKFMDLCSKGKHFEFMHTMYAADIVSVEGDGKEPPGKICDSVFTRYALQVMERDSI